MSLFYEVNGDFFPRSSGEKEQMTVVGSVVRHSVMDVQLCIRNGRTYISIVRCMIHYQLKDKNKTKKNWLSHCSHFRTLNSFLFNSRQNYYTTTCIKRKFVLDEGENGNASSSLNSIYFPPLLRTAQFCHFKIGTGRAIVYSY